MKRGIAARSLALLLAFVFGSGSVFPSFSDPCPIHDPGSAQLAMMSHAGHSARAMSHHLSAHSAKSEHDNTGIPSHHGSHRCTCIGSGDCAGAVMLPPNTLAFAPPALSANTAIPLAPVETRAYATAEHALPFSTAPPLFEA